MTNKHMTKYAASLVIREMQIKTVRYHFTPTKMPMIKKTHDNKYQMWGNWNSHTAGGNVKLCSCFGKQFSSFSKS